ncbi:MAG: esterase [Novosphingobium sp. 28-62-57]|uniref:alpha/beta hydrolase n=1 Tax=unclassified Novosphingobium TaxID=2644732 RepID=UPI000BD498DE|nr:MULTISPECIES: alpha/beta hydrolase [unclassified Novosphingobium]OYW51283.1 MAG: esterase [Novosphingobium sp. 12-62-10]OYZ36984.1 MAG: esterase [Novosphingobium sp. 16-62-11]OZA37187.1 MAG: esterase [Novosphingobium sp. 17-62-9]OYZ10578.1 MAG: esterase [Novosphingobium sp. 28-62-57]HQS68054.1 alpha/beta hydrolase [Novosphingobium sp.]
MKLRLRLIAVLLSCGMVAKGGTAAAQADIARTTMPAPVQPNVIDLPVTGCNSRSEIWHPDAGLAAVRNVTCPTLRAFLPKQGATGAAVIVAPGGAFMGLAIEKEGWQVAQWLADHGIAAFVLKYRTSTTPADQGVFVDELQKALRGQPTKLPALPTDTPPYARDDGLAALRYVRANAASLGVDPARVGFMGFSAGGFLTRTMVELPKADRPDFAAPIYPNMAAMSVAANAPPMFVAIAQDDFLLAREKGFPLIESYRAAGRPIEFHLFPGGGHGFGLGKPGTPPAGWIELMYRWLDRSGLLAAQPPER